MTHRSTLALAAILLACAACNDDGRGSQASSTPSARDFCAEAGFVDGEQRNDSGELIAECSEGPTPEGGAYSIARYSDADGPADKEDSTEVEITEYDADGNVLNTTYGTVGDH